MRERRLRELHREWSGGKRAASDMLKLTAGEHLRDEADYSPAESLIFGKLVGELLDRAGLLDRFAFAREIAALRHTPASVVTRLLDDDHLVASCVIEHAPFSDLELLKLIGARDCERVHCAIARRPALSETITDVLIGKGRPEVLTAIAGNRGARLSRASLEMLCDTAVRQSAMGKALAKRPDLPAHISGVLNRRLEVRHLVHATLSDEEIIELVIGGDEEAEEVAIAWRSPLSITITDFLIGRGRPRVLLTIAGNVGARISSGGFEVLAAIATDHAEMDEALARRSDLPAEIARHLHRRLGERMRARIAELVARDLARGRRPFVLRQQA
jgi:uncharacterized protein (DUF2336 family)